jgi:hypothetical protein
LGNICDKLAHAFRVLIGVGGRMLVFALFFALSILLPTSPTIAADGDMVWSFSEGNDASNRGRITARLGYGVPEQIMPWLMACAKHAVGPAMQLPA